MLARIKAQIEQYQGRVEGTPKREQELAGLTRDYNITQQNYQRLLDRFYEAKRAEDMEKRQQGEQFRVVDYAQPPEVPVSPNPMRIALVFLALGLGHRGRHHHRARDALTPRSKGVKQLEGLVRESIPCIICRFRWHSPRVTSTRQRSHEHHVPGDQRGHLRGGHGHHRRLQARRTLSSNCPYRFRSEGTSMYREHFGLQAQALFHHP
ncbi:MAG: hypothetical protein MZU91_03290 [Desulfosudis oleivorans]|nr:hypothetical protein [Desulfosudis oleivorans]